MALPCLPSELIVDAFHKLDRWTNTTELEEVWDYDWGMLRARTNNNIKDWHNRLKSRVNAEGPMPSYLLLLELHRDTTLLPLHVKLIAEAKLCCSPEKDEEEEREGRDGSKVTRNVGFVCQWKKSQVRCCSKSVSMSIDHKRDSVCVCI